jgi:hypothetical protein
MCLLSPVADLLYSRLFNSLLHLLLPVDCDMMQQQQAIHTHSLLSPLKIVMGGRGEGCAGTCTRVLGICYVIQQGSEMGNCIILYQSLAYTI